MSELTEKLDEFIAYISIGDESSPPKEELIDLLEDSRNALSDQQALIQELKDQLEEVNEHLEGMIDLGDQPDQMNESGNLFIANNELIKKCSTHLAEQVDGL